MRRSDYIRQKTKALREFGYNGLAEETVAAELAKVMAGDEGLTVIGHFIKGDYVGLADVGAGK